MRCWRRLRIVMTVLLCIGGAISQVWASVIVTARTDKTVYKTGEPVWVQLEVENFTDSHIIPKENPGGPWAGDLNTRNFSFALYRNEHFSLIPSYATLEGLGILTPVLWEPKDGQSEQVSVPPHSKTVVASGNLFDSISIAPGPPNLGPGQFVVKIRFAGIIGTTEGAGYAIVTFRVE